MRKNSPDATLDAIKEQRQLNLKYAQETRNIKNWTTGITATYPLCEECTYNYNNTTHQFQLKLVNRWCTQHGHLGNQ